ncbi:radical SAM family heme chaperone HemW [Caldilinea sp.]|uniref:radical SAM family heme chaperone HemW n=1 Tax=Caldilinea sp. TaxID=2293560 RepID=UPI002C090C48|nr:radical SAM family heme chaperone HemW [Anaerolineales bacterium]HQY90189.1 radical SAM family heme chaperone HemW [Caldilinea sp.]
MSELSPLGLYIHIPFCERKCPYCDFNTYAGLEALHQATVDALCAEMERWAARMAQYTVATIFIGGGTPTVLEARQLGQLFEAIHRCFRVAPTAEITCEANPGTVDQAKFAVLRTLGVNRLSMGVQSFRPDELRFLGRIHSAEDVYTAYATAREVGFANINLDFIFGLPGQTEGDWQATLDEALTLAPEHLSLYSLIVEPDTPLFHWVESGRSEAPDDDLAATLYEMALVQLGAAGYVHYEVSNWARRLAPEDEHSEMPRLACQHNLMYWRNQAYLGIGPGAHSHLHVHAGEVPVERRWGNRKPVAGYNRRVQAGGPLEEFVEEIPPRLAMAESMMVGLRLVREGVRLDRFLALHGVLPTAIFADELKQLHKAGLLIVDDERVQLTRRGLLMGNQVFLQFLPEA